MRTAAISLLRIPLPSFHRRADRNRRNGHRIFKKISEHRKKLVFSLVNSGLGFTEGVSDRALGFTFSDQLKKQLIRSVFLARSTPVLK